MKLVWEVSILWKNLSVHVACVKPVELLICRVSKQNDKCSASNLTSINSVQIKYTNQKQTNLLIINVCKLSHQNYQKILYTDIKKNNEK
jgi:hypothetical protein